MTKYYIDATRINPEMYCKLEYFKTRLCYLIKEQTGYRNDAQQYLDWIIEHECELISQGLLKPNDMTI